MVTCSSACPWLTACKRKAGVASAYGRGNSYCCCGNDEGQLSGSSCDYHPCGACPGAGCRAERN